MSATDFYCADGAFTVIFKICRSNHQPKVLMVQRQDTGIYELPGGGVEYDLEKGDNAFLDCAVRETSQETGFIPNPGHMVLDAVLRQRVLRPARMIGSVHLFHCYITDRDLVSDSFTGDETRSLCFMNFADIDFKDPGISLAARRMLIIFKSRYDIWTRGDSVISKWHTPFIGCLGKQIQYGDLLV